MVFKKIFDTIPEEAINLFESAFEIKLPKDYAQYLMNHNGGSVSPKVFNIGNESQRSQVFIFYGFQTNEEYKDYDLVDNIDLYESDFPNSFYPIGEDPGGNKICLNLNTNDYGKIYFWDHETASEDTPSVKDLILIADSFTDFLNKLY